MTHDIDLALYLGGEVKKITSKGLKKGKKIKFATSTLEHNNKCITRILSNSECAKKIRTLNITTNKNILQMEVYRQVKLLRDK